MNTAIRIVVFFFGLLFVDTSFAQSGLLPWPEVQKKISSHWAEHYPNEKILHIEQKGGVEYTATQKVQEDTSYSDWWGTTWVTTNKEIQGSFARQVALVSVERANKSRARFEVAALYRGVGKSWKFDQITLGPVTELGKPGDPSVPAKADAQRLFKDAWSKTRPDFEVEAVTVLAAPKIGQSGENRWLNYQLAITATGTAKASSKMQGKKYRCTPADYSSVLKWNDGAWVADESPIRDVNEASNCDLAGP
ncbi:MAG TPA: hypothetical protein VNW52_05945 [Burkholderiaceae bacterium]|jgi:hypothetical protein|nr:hypothetical protein [Burkholderiaceae bacterium]